MGLVSIVIAIKYNRKLKDSDFSIYALDSRGHGRSEGIRGHVDQFQYYIEDLLI